MKRRVFNGAAIDRMRKAQGLTYRELAIQIDCTQQSVLLWAHGKQEPRANQLVRIADTLGVSMDKLFKKGGRR